MAAGQKQMERFTHTSFQVTMYDTYVELAERLNALAPISGTVKVALFTTGAEATAIKIPRAATSRSGVIAFTGAFHGRTIVAMKRQGNHADLRRLPGGLRGFEPMAIAGAHFPRGKLGCVNSARPERRPSPDVLALGWAFCIGIIDPAS